MYKKVIMQWSKTETGQFIANWNGRAYTLFEHPQTRRWHLHADGKPVVGSWADRRTAMQIIDSRQTTILFAAMRERVPSFGTVSTV